MTMDVFITTFARTPERVGAAVQAISWWIGEREAGRVRGITVHDLGAHSSLRKTLRHLHGDDMPNWKLEYVKHPSDFQRLRHARAAELAKTQLYIVADDDLRPADRAFLTHEPWNEYVARTMAMSAHAKVAMAAAFAIPTNAYPEGWANDNRWHLWQDEQVSAVGGVRVVRRGAVPGNPTELPPKSRPGNGYDQELCEWLRGKQRTVGYFLRWPALHLGEWTTTVWC